MDTAVTTITTQLATNFASAQGIVIAAGLALVGLSFVSYILRKARGAANGRV